MSIIKWIRDRRIRRHHNKLMDSARKSNKFRIMDEMLMKKSGDTIIFNVD